MISWTRFVTDSRLHLATVKALRTTIYATPLISTSAQQGTANGRPLFSLSEDGVANNSGAYRQRTVFRILVSVGWTLGRGNCTSPCVLRLNKITTEDARASYTEAATKQRPGTKHFILLYRTGLSPNV